MEEDISTMSTDTLVMTEYLDPNTGTKVRMKVPAREIVRNPNRHIPEAILHSVCICLNALLNNEENKMKNFSSLTDKITHEGKKSNEV